MGAYLRATNLYTAGSFDPDHDAVMRIGVGLQPTGLTRGEAPGGEPILSVGIKCQVRIRLPATSDLNSAVVLKASASGRMVVCSFRVSRFTWPDVRRRPSNGSPVVTKRQSAMISLRASATIMVLRVPLRLSAVRARYHNANGLSF